MGGAPMNAAVPEMDGALAYPRKNGEPVFDAPWQSRAFGMVVGLHKAGLYPWDEFKALLIDEIAKDSCAAPAGSAEYYYQWMDAFSRLLVAKGILSSEEIDSRIGDFRTGIRQDVF
jgi:nitrile hydratase accessory protein